MKRKTEIFLAVIFLVLFLSGRSFALQAATCQMSTLPKIVTYQDDWYGDPNVYSSTNEVSPCNTVSIHVASGGFGRPPYTLQVSGSGFSFDTPDGPAAQVTTGADMKVVTLRAACSGSCGTAEIKVTDSGGFSTTGNVKSTNGGWIWDRTCDDGFGGHYTWTRYSDDGTVMAIIHEHCSSSYTSNSECCNEWPGDGICQWCWSQQPYRYSHMKVDYYTWGCP